MFVLEKHPLIDCDLNERFEGVRRINLAGFPYAVFFMVNGGTVFILAVLHSARDLRAALQRRSAEN